MSYKKIDVSESGSFFLTRLSYNKHKLLFTDLSCRLGKQSINVEKGKILGLRTVIYAAPNLIKAKEWYTKAFGIAPYFDEPFYVGFNVGGYELGLDPNVTPAEGSTLTYWGVTTIETAVQQLLDLGATAHTDIQEVGEGIKVVTVRDPFGNVVGLIENPHFSLE